MKMNAILKPTIPVVLGVILAGLIMYYGRDLPLLGDARKGFDD